VGAGAAGLGALVGTLHDEFSLVERRCSGWRRRADCLSDPGNPNLTSRVAEGRSLVETRRLFRSRARAKADPRSARENPGLHQTCRARSMAATPGAHRPPGVLPGVDPRHRLWITCPLRRLATVQCGRSRTSFPQ
jgi:hypothetical protein